MGGKLAVTWATPVDTATVGAQLEAYIETKETIAIFQQCVQSAPTDSAVAQLPPELIKYVANHFQSSIFQDKLAGWEREIECCSGICDPIDHFDPDEIQSLRKDYMQSLQCPPDDLDDYDSDFGGYLGENHDIVGLHDRNVETLLSKVASHFPPMCDTQFARSRKGFSDDFGLEIHFSVLQKAEIGAYSAFQRTKAIFSYLTIPSSYSLIKAKPGPLYVSISSATVLDPRMLTKEPHTELQERFNRGMQALCLEPHTHRQHMRSSYPTSDAYTFAAEGRTREHWKDSQPEYRRTRQDHACSKSGEATATEWPKLMALATGFCDADPQEEGLW